MSEKYLAFQRESDVLILDIGRDGEWLGRIHVKFPTLKNARAEWKFSGAPFRTSSPLTGEDIRAWRVYR